MQKKCIMVLFPVLFFVLFTVPLWSVDVQYDLGPHQWYLEISDIYYFCSGMVFSFDTNGIPHIDLGKEKNLYLKMLKEFFPPRYVVLEGGFMPIQNAGALLRTALPEGYSQLYIGEQHLVQAMTASVDYPEPWSCALFLGNVYKFKSSESNKSGGKAYSGLLAAYGNRHLYNDMYIKDHWLETEMKIKGERKNNDIQLAWNFRIGGRFHFHPHISHLAYISFERERTDYEEKGFSFLRNTHWGLRYDMGTENFVPLRLSMHAGKKYPFIRREKKKNIVVGLDIGFFIDFNTIYGEDILEKEFVKNEIKLTVKPLFKF